MTRHTTPAPQHALTANHGAASHTRTSEGSASEPVWRVLAHMVIRSRDDTPGRTTVVLRRTTEGRWVFPGGYVHEHGVYHALRGLVRDQTGLRTGATRLAGGYDADTAPAPTVVLFWETVVPHAALIAQNACHWVDLGHVAPRDIATDLALFDGGDHLGLDFLHLAAL